MVLLSWLAERQIPVLAWCECCQHKASLSAQDLIERLGDAGVPAIASTMVCSCCGGREIETRPDWPTSGVGVAYAGDGDWTAKHANGRGAPVKEEA